MKCRSAWLARAHSHPRGPSRPSGSCAGTMVARKSVPRGTGHSYCFFIQLLHVHSHTQSPRPLLRELRPQCHLLSMRPHHTAGRQFACGGIRRRPGYGPLWPAAALLRLRGARLWDNEGLARRSGLLKNLALKTATTDTRPKNMDERLLTEIPGHVRTTGHEQEVQEIEVRPAALCL